MRSASRRRTTSQCAAASLLSSATIRPARSAYSSGLPPTPGRTSRRCAPGRRRDRGVLVVAVVGLVGQSEAGLAEVDQVPRRILRVGVDVEAPRRRLRCAEDRRSPRPARPVPAAAAIPASSSSRGLGRGFRRRPRRRSWRRGRRCAARRCPLPGIRCRRPCGSGGFGDDLVYLLLGAVVQLAERAVGGAVTGHRVFGQPTAVDVAEEIVLPGGPSGRRGTGRSRSVASLPSRNHHYHAL